MVNKIEGAHSRFERIGNAYEVQKTYLSKMNFEKIFQKLHLTYYHYQDKIDINKKLKWFKKKKDLFLDEFFESIEEDYKNERINPYLRFKSKLNTISTQVQISPKSKENQNKDT